MRTIEVAILYVFSVETLLGIPLKYDLEETDFGKTAVLNCRSNDLEHNFMFWQLPSAGGEIVGPGNDKFDKTKYDYEILSGKLFIKSVSKDEEGIYECISQGVKNDNINIRKVRMVVRKDWEDVYEHDASVNFFRVIILIGFIAIIVGGSYIVYKNWKSKKNPPDYLLPSDEEDSAEEVFSKPSTSKGHIVLHKQFSGVYDNQGLSTDFKSILSEK